MSRALAAYYKTVIASASRTATNNSVEIYNPGGYRGIRLYIDVTAATSTPSTVFSIQVKDPVGLDWSATLLDSAAQVGAITAPVVMDVYPGTVAVANAVANRHIGKSFRVLATHGNANAQTYSVAVEFLP